MTLEEQTVRGAKAKALMEDPILRDAIERVQQHVFDEFARTDPADTGALQLRRLELKALADVVRMVKEVIDSGKIAAHSIEQETKLQKMQRRFGLR